MEIPGGGFGLTLTHSDTLFLPQVMKRTTLHRTSSTLWREPISSLRKSPASVWKRLALSCLRTPARTRVCILGPKFPYFVHRTASLSSSGYFFDVLVQWVNSLYTQIGSGAGGVTSSSLEVFAGLALSDEEHSQHMCVGADGTVPAFYQSYVQAVQVCQCS